MRIIDHDTFNRELIPRLEFHKLGGKILARLIAHKLTNKLVLLRHAKDNRAAAPVQKGAQRMTCLHALAGRFLELNSLALASGD